MGNVTGLFVSADEINLKANILWFASHDRIRWQSNSTRPSSTAHQEAW